MPMLFNADEVFEMAEQIEVNGARFYRAAAEKFPALSEMLLDLAFRGHARGAFRRRPGAAGIRS